MKSTQNKCDCGEAYTDDLVATVTLRIKFEPIELVQSGFCVVIHRRRQVSCSQATCYTMAGLLGLQIDACLYDPCLALRSPPGLVKQNSGISVFYLHVCSFFCLM
jgi:hypothetical protein